ncbi:hypothetical protein ACFSFZ_10420 [Mixta tenebrionis]|uniref:Uncharacterized protein n=1 Tax=Mixta tenebrionis TaxID=2562439 RepID=A0A506UZ72_9GAMM|nr:MULTISPECIES: hypothetical protein [Mixta]QHM75082.1 hypothetical protein C7M52_01031 [Mixta theicola]TPW38714.1 hypothetical protein FKM52_20350 [Mixta tenebrionis]
MNAMKKMAVSNIFALCHVILFAHLSSLQVMYNSSPQHIYDVLLVAVAFFGFKYLCLRVINFFWRAPS